MKLITHTAIPDSTMFKIVNNCYSLYPATMLHNLTDLRYNLRDKFNIANNIIHVTKCSHIKDLFSPRDMNIIQQTIERTALSNPIDKFLKKILSDNMISYNDQPGSMIMEILKIPVLEEIDNNETYTYFYKWLSFANKKNEKISTLIKNEIYMPFPIEFNDRFDCQLHLHPSFITQLAGGSELGASKVKFFQVLATEFIVATSFSLHNPHKIDSLHMWGLYGNRGAGIAVAYALDDLITLLIANHNPKLNTPPLMFANIKYVNNYNPGEIFTQCCNNYINTNNTKYVKDFWLDFTITKSQVWEHEKELRFFSNIFNDKIAQKISEAIKGETHLGPEKFSQITEIRDTYLNKSIPFILPKEFIFGWEASMNELSDIVNFANKGTIKIPITILDKHINYETNQFYLN